MLTQEQDLAVNQKTLTRVKKILANYTDVTYSVTKMKTLVTKSEMSAALSQEMADVLGDLLLDLTDNSLYSKILNFPKKKKDEIIIQ